MGKRGNQKRAFEKRLAIKHGYRYSEDEFGNIKIKLTKAALRRQFLQRIDISEQVTLDLMSRLTRQVYDDICVQEDARVLAILEAIANGSD